MSHSLKCVSLEAAQKVQFMAWPVPMRRTLPGVNAAGKYIVGADHALAGVFHAGLTSVMPCSAAKPVLCAGAVNTLCTLLRDEKKRCAAVTMLGKTAEHCLAQVGCFVPAANSQSPGQNRHWGHSCGRALEL